ncbi:indoleamine 2,3-dioxygenase [Ceratobasidium sp. AG-Ba]|nr:indoleamine 2,3-dioxygenase [Ceratobasidium sp. AG-Ba]
MSLSSISPVHTIRYVARAAAQLLPSVLQPAFGDSRATPEASTSRQPPPPRFDPADYDVDPTSGFLPSEPPLSRLPADFELWECALDAANAPNGVLSLGEDMSEQALAKRESSRKWRESIASAPVLSTTSLQGDVRLLRRAHHVLAFLVHFYVHSTPPAQPAAPMRVPKSLAVPLVEVSRVLEIAPVLTFADTVLWNYALIDSSKPLSADNIRSQTLFTASNKAARDEQNFYLCCLGIEIRGIEALQIITKYQNMPSVSSPQAVAEIKSALSSLCSMINDLTSILTSVRCTCDPHAFYFAIRPWFRGSDAGGPNSPGWIFEGVGDSTDLELSGPSAGQSSLMHSLDVFFDIDHKLEKPRLPAPSEQNKKSDRTFMQRMQRYMPGRHQQFLNALGSSANPLREVVVRTPALHESYDSCIKALKAFRDAHMRIACLYVVSMSRSEAAQEAARKAGCPVAAMFDKMRENGELPAPPVTERKVVRGTGGNELSNLLKACRDATTRALVSQNEARS